MPNGLREMRPAIALLFVILSSSVARSANEDHTVQGLLGQCKQAAAYATTPDALYCVAYVAAVWDEMKLIGDVRNKMNVDATSLVFGACGDPTYGAAVQAFINWSEKNPQFWSLDRAVGVNRALVEAWPCQ